MTGDAKGDLALAQVQVRPLEKNDRQRLVGMFRRLSPETIYRRFLSPIHEPSESGLSRLLDLDHSDREGLAAIVGDDIVGIARYGRLADPGTAEVAVVVQDSWQHRGVSLLLLENLAKLARQRGVTAFKATIMSDNSAAIRMVKRAVPSATFRLEGTEVLAHLPLDLQPTSGL